MNASRFEVERRRARLPQLREAELNEITHEAAAQALTDVLLRMDEFRGASPFTTWASKFAVLEASTRLRKLEWHGRESVDARLGRGRFVPSMPRELRRTLEQAMIGALAPRERHVFGASVFNGVPIDVLADELHATRGEVYDTLRNARKALRQRIDSTQSTTE